MYEGPNPVEVLEKLLGTGEEPSHDAVAGGSSIREEDLELEPDFGGLSLKALTGAEAQESEQSHPPETKHRLNGDCRSMICHVA